MPITCRKQVKRLKGQVEDDKTSASHSAVWQEKRGDDEKGGGGRKR